MLKNIRSALYGTFGGILSEGTRGFLKSLRICSLCLTRWARHNWWQANRILKPAHCRGGRPESVRTWHFFHGKDLGICMWPPRFGKPTSNAIRRPDPPPSRPLQRRGRIPHASGSPHMRTMGVSSYGSICRLWMARFYTVKVFQQAL